MLPVTISKMQLSDQKHAYALVQEVFTKQIAPDFSADGNKEFLSAAQRMIFQQTEEHLILLANSGQQIVGILDLRSDGHICPFFVKNSAQGKGIGRKLFNQATKGFNSLSVNSSLIAVKAYEKLGFTTVSEVQTRNGITYLPMVKD